MVWRTRLRRPAYRRTDLQMPHRNHRKPPRQPLFQASPAGLATRKDRTFPFSFLRGRVRLCAGHSRARPSNTRRKPIISMYERVLRDDDWRDRQRRPTCEVRAVLSHSRVTPSRRWRGGWPHPNELAARVVACANPSRPPPVMPIRRQVHCRDAHLLCDIQPVRKLRLA
jgi:hypothetical protein